MEYKNLRHLSEKKKLILGSGSPRRVALLEELDISFEQVIPSIDESINSNEEAVSYALRMAEEKSLKAFQLYSKKNNDNRCIFIGCDTIVTLGDKIMGKPEDEKEAVTILALLSGKQHIVTTAIAMVVAGEIFSSESENTTVFFNELSGDDILNYVKSGEPMDKAGAYGIQGMGAFLVDRIEGNLDNVIGLPRMLLDNLAGQFMNNLDAG